MSEVSIDANTHDSLSALAPVASAGNGAANGASNGAHETAVDMSAAGGDASRAALARKAFRAQDPELSRLAHMLPAEETHQTSGEALKTIVFGGLDGIITTFSIIASITGANISTGAVIVLGISKLFADGISMAFGEYVGESSEKEWVTRERSREKWEFENYREGEMREMIELYKQKGITEEDATEILTIMGNHKDFFIDHMMVQELGIVPDDNEDKWAAIKGAGIMFLSFLIFGFVPLISFVIFHPINWPNFDPTFLVACILTGLALFGLGAFKSQWESTAWWRGGSMVMFNGALAAAVAYAIAKMLEVAFNLEC